MSERFLRERKLLYPSEQLFESLKLLDPPFQRLGDLHPLQQPSLQRLLSTTYVRKNCTSHEQPLFLHEPTLRDILDQNIKYLISKGLTKYVQTYGFELRNGMLHLRIYNFGRTALQDSAFKELLNFLPTLTVSELIYNYTIILQANGHHIQVTGPSLHESFNSKIGEKRKKADVKPTDYANFIIHRFQIFYCTHFGRDPGIFRKNFFFEKGVKPSSNPPEEIARIATHYAMLLYNQRALHMAKQQKQKFLVLFKEFITRLRMFFVMGHDKKGKRWSEFSHLLHKICPLPNNYRHLRRLVQSKEISKQQTKKTFDDLYQYAVEYKKVANLLIEILKKVLPQQILGSQNTENLFDMMNEFVSMKRYQNFKIEDILTQFDVFKVQWLKDAYNPKYKKHIIGRRRKIIGKFVCLLFNNLIIPILKYNFYITEKHKESNRLFYYRKPVWFLISTLALNSFSQENIKQISTIEKLQKNNYPQGKLRIMPKKGTFRPIITFNRRGRINEGSKLTLNLNQILNDTQLVLRNLKNILGQKFGYCVFDNRQVAQKYDAFVQKWRSKGCPRLSFFALDIKKCYDSINPEKLLQFIKQTKLIQDVYLIVKYLRLYRNKKPLNNKQSMQYYFNLRERATAVPLTHNPSEIREPCRPPSIHIHTTRSRLITRDVIIDHLSHLCQASLITYQKRKWIQRFGIPQGLNVSGVLCSLYFAYLEDMYAKVNDGVLMRLTDDYLYIGTEEEARKVLNGLLKCSKSAEFEFNQEKVIGNFSSPHIKSLWTKDMFVWIGKQINIKTLQMFPVTDSDPKKLLYSMNVNIPRKTMRNFLKNKLKSLLTNQFQSYFKPHLFPKETLVQNIRIFSKISLNKFFPFLQKLIAYRLPELPKTMLKILQIALHEFIVYACYLFGQQQIDNHLYYELMLPALKEFELFFKGKRHLKRDLYTLMEKKFKGRVSKTEKGLKSYERQIEK